MAKKALSKQAFASNAVEAFEQTHNSLFLQAGTEVRRLEKINRAMEVIERRLLDPDTLEHLEMGQQMALMELLMRSSNTTIGNLQKFAAMMKDIKNITGTHANIMRQSSIDAEYENDIDLENFPLLDRD